MRMASGAHLRGEGDGEATKEECPIDRGVATSACRQRYRWHLEKNATQMWRYCIVVTYRDGGHQALVGPRHRRAPPTLRPTHPDV